MIGEKLSALLKAKNVKPGTLASQTGVPKSTIYSIIKRDSKSVELSVMERICDALDVPVEYFYDRPSVAGANDDKKRTAPETGSGQITAVELEAAEIIRRLPPEKKQDALKYLRYLESREDT